jgi:hypothetical protein
LGEINNLTSATVSAPLKPYFDSPRLDLTVFGLRPNKSKTIRQKNLKKIKFYHVGLVNILLNSHKAEKLTISSKNRLKKIFLGKQGLMTRWPA